MDVIRINTIVLLVTVFFGGVYEIDEDLDEPPPSIEQITYLPYTSEEAAKISELRGEVRELESEVKRLEKALAKARDKASTASRSDKETKEATKTREIEVEATFYTAFCDTGCTGVTATGVNVKNTIYHEGKRVIAVDPTVIPLGSAVIVELANGNTFEATAQDTGGAIKGRKIDVLVESRSEAISLGRQTARIKFLK